MAKPSHLAGTMVTSGHCPILYLIVMISALWSNNENRFLNAQFLARPRCRNTQLHLAGPQHPVLVPAALYSGSAETDYPAQGVPGAVHQGHHLDLGILGGLQHGLDETDPQHPLAGNRRRQPETGKLVPGTQQPSELGGYLCHAAGV